MIALRRAGDAAARLAVMTALAAAAGCAAPPTATASDAPGAGPPAPAGPLEVRVPPHQPGPASRPATFVLRAGQEVVARVWMAHTAKTLHLRYRVRDASGLSNRGDDQTMLFKTGDSVDLQIGVDPAAPPGRIQPVPGDVRVLMTRTKAGPIAVVYRYRVPGTREPVRFGSPMGRVLVDRVERLRQAKLSATILDDGYVWTAEIPWSALAGKAFAPRPGTRLRGDVGVLFSDPGGGTTVERIYWANQDTGVVADVPTEIRLAPARWGTFVLAGPGQ